MITHCTLYCGKVSHDNTATYFVFPPNSIGENQIKLLYCGQENIPLFDTAESQKVKLYSIVKFIIWDCLFNVKVTIKQYPKVDDIHL
jgi:hypothetical protein